MSRTLSVLERSWTWPILSAVTLCTTDECITVGLELRTEHEPLSATRYLRLIGEHDDDDDNDTHSDQTSDDLPLMLAQPSVLRPLSLSLSGSHAISVDLSLTLSLPLSIELIMFKLRIEFVVNFSWSTLECRARHTSSACSRVGWTWERQPYPIVVYKLNENIFCASNNRFCPTRSLEPFNSRLFLSQSYFCNSSTLKYTIRCRAYRFTYLNWECSLNEID